MPSTMRPTLNIVGCGKVGRTLARLWHATGIVQLQDIVNRTPDSTAAAIAFIGGGTPATLPILRRADLTLVGSGDDQIPSLADALAATTVPLDGTIAFHCSGALPASVLAPLQQRGAAIASVHPVRSFALPEKVVAQFDGTWCGVEGDPSAIAALEPLFAGIGARFVTIASECKVLYHAGAVFASNYLVTLLDTAVQVYGKAGIAPDVALQMMSALVRETADNVLQDGAEKALTGPIARGDAGTVIRQYHAIKEGDALQGDLYRRLGRLTHRLAKRARGNRR